MISLFKPNETNFTTNGLGSLDKNIINPIVAETLNGTYTLTFTYPLFAPHGIEIDGQSIIRCPVPDSEQLFRVYNPVKSMGYIEAKCYHIFYDLSDNFIEDTNVVNKNGDAALKQLGNATQYKHMFEFYSDIMTVSTSRMVRTNPVAAILDTSLDNSFINRWGGELKRDNFAVKMMQHIGSNKGVTIRDKKNLTGYESDVDWSSPVTRIMPKGFDGLLLPELYVDSPLIDNYAYPKIKMIEYGDIKAAIGDSSDSEDAVPLEEAYELLRQAARKEYSDNKLDIPNANYKVEFADLENTKEYEDFKPLETISIGDTVTVIHSEDKLYIEAEMIDYEFNPLSKKYIKIELGNYSEMFSSTISKVNNLDNKVTELKAQTKSVQLSADKKNRIFRGSDIPVNPNKNDMWYQPENPDMQMSQFDGNSWVPVLTSTSSLVGTLDFSKITATNFSANNLAAGNIDINSVGIINNGNSILSINAEQKTVLTIDQANVNESANINSASVSEANIDIASIKQLNIVRSDGTIASSISAGEDDTGLNVNLFSKSTNELSGMIAISEDGSITTTGSITATE